MQYMKSQKTENKQKTHQVAGRSSRNVCKSERTQRFWENTVTYITFTLQNTTSLSFYMNILISIFIKCLHKCFNIT